MVRRSGTKLLSKDCRGDIQDVVFVVVALFFFAFTTLVSFVIFTNLNFELQNSDFISVDGKSVANSLEGQFSGTLDNIFLFLAVGLVIVTLIFASLVRVHPIFIPFFIIALIVVVFVSSIVSEVYRNAALQTAFVTQANQLTFISTIVGYMPLFTTVLGGLLIIVLYKIGGDANV